MTKKYSKNAIREKACSLLKKYKIRIAPVPVEELAQKLGADLRYVPYDDDDEGEFSGMLFRDETQIIIGVNSLHHPNRQRFTIAHELGHLLLHRGKEVHIDRIYRVNLRNAVSSQATNHEEIEANRFAAELLMPHEFLMKDVEGGYIDIEEEDEITELAQKYKVSIQAMTFRLTNLLDYG